MADDGASAHTTRTLILDGMVAVAALDWMMEDLPKFLLQDHDISAGSSCLLSLPRPRRPPRPISSPLNEAIWPAPGSEDTELGALMEPEVGHGETEVYARVQA
jgi:hypothetical protein